MKVPSTSCPQEASRPIAYRTSGHQHGPITRLMSPGDLGQSLKPFVLLDLIDVSSATMQAIAEMPLHPHSGIATVTLITEGHVRYEDPGKASGTLGYGGVEWMRAGGGVWHGKELSPGDAPRIQAFQLWLALPPHQENSAPVSRYIEAPRMPQAGPAHVIVGRHDGVQSPVPAPEGINYLLVTLRPGESWIYRPPAGHLIGWLAVAQGSLDAGTRLSSGEMAIFEPGQTSVTLTSSGKENAVFVLGSAVPHPYALHLGQYSVHTSAQALTAGERRIQELALKLREAGDRRTDSGSIPVFL